jgi:hypothetical protein
MLAHKDPRLVGAGCQTVERRIRFRATRRSAAPVTTSAQLLMIPSKIQRLITLLSTASSTGNLESLLCLWPTKTRNTKES